MRVILKVLLLRQRSVKNCSYIIRACRIPPWNKAPAVPVQIPQVCAPATVAGELRQMWRNVVATNSRKAHCEAQPQLNGRS